MRRTVYFLAIAWHLSALLFAGYLGEVEGSVFQYGPVQDLTFRKRALESAVDIGYSYYSTNRFLNSCLNGLRSFEQQLATDADRDAFATICRQKSDRILRFAPFNPLASTVKATAAQQLGDFSDMNTSLAKGQRIAPNEQWLAIGRYQLAVENVGSLSAEAKIAYNADLALLAQSKFGVRAIAQRYVSDPDFRENITNIVSTLPDETQKRFLNSVRTVLKNAN